MLYSSACPALSVTFDQNFGLAELSRWQGVWSPACEQYCNSALCDITEAWLSEAALSFEITFQQQSDTLLSLSVARIGATTQIAAQKKGSKPTSAK